MENEGRPTLFKFSLVHYLLLDDIFNIQILLNMV